MTQPQLKIFFNEELHKYTDDLGNTYTSATTVIGKYEIPFDTDAMAKACSRKYWNVTGHRYHRMTVAQIKADWVDINKTACDKGNMKHNYLEDAINASNGYKKIANSTFINDRIYLIPDIIANHNYGQVDASSPLMLALQERYPIIFNTIVYYLNRGFKFYAEIGVYDIHNRLISGLIDLLLINHDTKEFKIVDWKTNKNELHFSAGYFKRDKQGNDTSVWVAQPHKRLKYPLHGIQDCHGSIYTLQLSLYAHLVEQFGYTNTGIYLFHIRERTIIGIGGEEEVEEFVKHHVIDFWKYDVERMIQHHYDSNKATLNTQRKLF